MTIRSYCSVSLVAVLITAMPGPAVYQVLAAEKEVASVPRQNFAADTGFSLSDANRDGELSAQFEGRMQIEDGIKENPQAGLLEEGSTARIAHETVSFESPVEAQTLSDADENRHESKAVKTVRSKIGALALIVGQILKSFNPKTANVGENREIGAKLEDELLNVHSAAARGTEDAPISPQAKDVAVALSASAALTPAAEHNEVAPAPPAEVPARSISEKKELFGWDRLKLITHSADYDWWHWTKSLTWFSTFFSFHFSFPNCASISPASFKAMQPRLKFFPG